MSDGRSDLSGRTLGRERTRRAVHTEPPPSEPTRAANSLAVRWRVHLAAGEAGQALGAAQGRALRALLATLGEVEVGQGEEDELR